MWLFFRSCRQSGGSARTKAVKPPNAAWLLVAMSLLSTKKADGFSSPSQQFVQIGGSYWKTRRRVVRQTVVYEAKTSSEPPNMETEETYSTSVQYDDATEESKAKGFDAPSSDTDLEEILVRRSEEEQFDTNSVCRVVANSDGMIPASKHVLPAALFSDSLFRTMDAIYHASSHSYTSKLTYMDRSTSTTTTHSDDFSESLKSTIAQTSYASQHDPDEEKRLVSLLRTSLHDAGFELLTQRDIDLCGALNAGYLLRLSIVPRLKSLDPCIGQELYPELYFSDNSDKELEGKDNFRIGLSGMVEQLATLAQNDEPSQGNIEKPQILDTVNASSPKSTNKSFDTRNTSSTTDSPPTNQLLFDGRVLVFRRGYSEEVTRGRLLLPKFDYLQASLVQRSAAGLTRRIARFERQVERLLVKSIDSFQRPLKDFFNKVSRRFSSDMSDSTTTEVTDNEFNDPSESEDSVDYERESKVFKLLRYGGSKVHFVGSSDLNNALDPFLVCDLDGTGVARTSAEAYMRSLQQRVKGSHDDTSSYRGGVVTCLYDLEHKGINGAVRGTHPVQLLRRVSINNLVDIFTRDRRRHLFESFVSKSELVEPTYEEVVVVWRPLPEKPKKQAKFIPPKSIYNLAEIFDLEDRLPQKPELEPYPASMPLEIRAYGGVPMANLLAVLPKTKLIFRPADALIFDLITVLSFGFVLASQRYDIPKLDFLAVASVAFWILRTVLRYSNKLARYDLLVNKFLTSKISHRGSGALKYCVTEAGSQRAIRAALVHMWLLQHHEARMKLRSREKKHEDETYEIEEGKEKNAPSLTRDEIIEDGFVGVNDLLNTKKLIHVDVGAGLDDLEDLGLIQFSDLGGRKVLEIVKEGNNAEKALQTVWNNLFHQ